MLRRMNESHSTVTECAWGFLEFGEQIEFTSIETHMKDGENWICVKGVG